mmetsp:Transcript_28144/g.64402  ORF Transcript_28144/g.64402 Transcript_28144/m.64402 type:complete len:318 (-) Transcript_28144:391-1344(-)
MVTSGRINVNHIDRPFQDISRLLLKSNLSSPNDQARITTFEADSQAQKTLPDPSIDLFVSTLRTTLSNEKVKSVISWLPDGKSWKIHNQDAFANVILPFYFGNRLHSYETFLYLVSKSGFNTLIDSSTGIFFSESFNRENRGTNYVFESKCSLPSEFRTEGKKNQSSISQSNHFFNTNQCKETKLCTNRDLVFEMPITQKKRKVEDQENLYKEYIGFETDKKSVKLSSESNALNTVSRIFNDTKIGKLSAVPDHQLVLSLNIKQKNGFKAYSSAMFSKMLQNEKNLDPENISEISLTRRNTYQGQEIMPDQVLSEMA